MAKLLMPLFIASFIFITKRYWWTIVVSFLVDLWCIANLIYYKTYDDFLTVNDILLVGNMDGAWSAVTAYIDWIMVVLILLTALWSAVIILLRHCRNERHWRVFIISFLVVYALAFLNNYFIYNQKFWNDEDAKKASEKWLKMANQLEEERYILYMPYAQICYLAFGGDISGKEAWCFGYIRQQSILSYFISNILYYVAYPNLNGEIITLNNVDLAIINDYVGDNIDTQNYVPKENLIILLVESLEDWPLNGQIENNNIAPNLQSLCSRRHILYCNKIKSQTLGGNSGDGQMIINTGLLPIQNGVACMNYGNVLYPNIAHCYSTTILTNPWPAIWNQDTMSVRYGYQEKIEPHNQQWEDKIVLDTTLHLLRQFQSPFFSMVITMSTHSPFTAKRNRLETSAPLILDGYMQCLNYTDSCIGAFMDAVLSDSVLSQSTIVITGDHTIFKPAMLTEFKDYTTAQNLSIASGDNFCPLIIYSPSIEGNIQVTDTCYQMDIYPTIMHLIGCEDYYWKGFGVNLLDSTARHNRPITEQEAYRLSDLMIRSDYFRQYMGKE